MKKIRVMIVDDSSVVRMTLTKALGKFPDIEVVGAASDPFFARDKIIKMKPDVLTLDVNMPRMDGLTFLKKLMLHLPIPTIMVSGLTKKGCETTLNCLAAGAIDFVTKPDESHSMGDMVLELVEKIHIAYRAKVVKKVQKKTEFKAPVKLKGKISINTKKIIAIGASTGGTEALASVISKMPAESPPVMIVQHMPEAFTGSFAARLNNLSAMEVREAKDSETLTPGLVLIAPGSHHIVLKRSGDRYFVRLDDGPPVCRHRPSVDMLFKSVVKSAGANSVGVILTGMGEDGAHGLLEMKNAGSKTIAQDENSCVVFGMPKEAIKLGAVDKVVSLSRVPQTIMSMLMS